MHLGCRSAYDSSSVMLCRDGRGVATDCKMPMLKRIRGCTARAASLFMRSLMPPCWLAMLALLAGCQGEPRVLQVGADKPYRSLGAAVADAGDGDTILVDSGTYLNDFVTITASLHI